MSDIINIFDNWLNKSRSANSPSGSPVPGKPHVDSLSELNYLPEVIFKIDANGKWLFLNDKWTEYTDYSIEECLGKNWLNNIHPKDHDACQEYVRRARKERPDNLVAPIRIISKQNSLRWMEMRANALPGDDSNSFTLLGTLTDISAEKSENERQHASYRALFSLVSNIPGMIYRCRYNRDWTMEFVSSGCTPLTGYDTDHVINNKTAWNDIIHPEAREYVWMTIQSAVQNQQPFELTYRIVTRDGNEKWVWERGQGNFSANGELLGLEGLITDITDNKRQSLRIERDTLFDPLTKLATQHLFLNRIQHAIELAKQQPNHCLSVVMIHIDQHSSPNNDLNNTESDELAKDIGNRIKNILNPAATVCRLRDDEFGILLEHCPANNKVSLRRSVRSIQSCLKAPITRGDKVLYAKTSIGVAQYKDHASNSDILRDANRAMVQARELGGSKIEFADPQQNIRMAAILGTESELRQALEKGELELICQPLKGPANSQLPERPQALEMKLAWHHARRGILFADSFYEHIEDLELTHLLGKFILNEIPRLVSTHLQPACVTQVYIHGLGELVLNEDMSGEISTKLSTLQNSKLSFIVDIDDYQLNNLSRLSLSNLKHLQQQGIGVAATDLQVAAPYAELLTLPGIKAIKLSVSHAPLNSAQLSSYNAIIACYHAHNINVIAKGVDTPEINQSLQATDFDYLQGAAISATQK